MVLEQKNTSDFQPGTREYMAAACEGRHAGTVQIMRHFAWHHLPKRLQSISKNCADLALHMMAMTPDGPELTAGLRKLLEAKDCFVRAYADSKE